MHSQFTAKKPWPRLAFSRQSCMKAIGLVHDDVKSKMLYLRSLGIEYHLYLILQIGTMWLNRIDKHRQLL